MEDLAFNLVGTLIVLPLLFKAVIVVRAGLRSRGVRAGREVAFVGRAVGAGIPAVHLGAIIARPGSVEIAEDESPKTPRSALPAPGRATEIVVLPYPQGFRGWTQSWDSQPRIRYVSEAGLVEIFCRSFDVDTLVDALRAAGPASPR